MNRLYMHITGALIIVIVLLLSGRLIFLAGIDKKITDLKVQISRLEATKQSLDDNVAKLLKHTKNLPEKNNEILHAGNEAELYNKILNCTAKTFRLKSFDTLPTYFIKPKEEDGIDMGSFGGVYQPGQKLPELNDQGMPVNAVTQEADEWKGVEILPVKFNFKTTFYGLGKFFTEAKRILPLHAVRNMDLIFDGSGIVRGTIVFIFPESDEIY